jgi:glycine oxidase
MAGNPDVVVIGAGGIGASVAYSLSTQGARVTLIDKESVGAGASFRATGNFSPRNFATHHHFLLAMEGERLSREQIPALMEETGIETFFQVKPAITMALDEKEAKVLGDIMAQKSEYIAMRWVTPKEIRELEPRVTPGVLTGIYSDPACQVDSYRLNLAYARGAEMHGAETLTREATGLEKSGERVTGVVHRSGVIPCDAVVIAMGAWSGETSRWLGSPVPVEPLKGERLQLRYEGPDFPYKMFTMKRGHIISRKDGFLSVGSTGGRYYFDSLENRQPGYDCTPTEEAKQELLQDAMDVLPCLEQAELVL